MSAPTMTATTPPTRRKVVCTDALRRAKHVTTYCGSGCVVLLAPAAEAALLDPAGARQLAEHLIAHADEIENC